ncbi:hypothetical protein H257_09885 [Aphanomyces astaci]|uniref:Uncharacterized protein n=1 Tax=Aphanomyces astaci TaxID=112090 RepID=W4GA32_APHAT|nr:hypothetical protein H257_09885 [Aphanomyces astaci]ETV75924.1 hypothetical protein H257_09885 [Aphanomyces astaci]|eukprot:XP_009834566.1 hypothetical protein H257_09885 [Aphanomyces astaci]
MASKRPFTVRALHGTTRTKVVAIATLQTPPPEVLTGADEEEIASIVAFAASKEDNYFNAMVERSNTNAHEASPSEMSEADMMAINHRATKTTILDKTTPMKSMQIQHRTTRHFARRQKYVASYTTKLQQLMRPSGWFSNDPSSASNWVITISNGSVSVISLSWSLACMARFLALIWWAQSVQGCLSPSQARCMTC